MLRLLAAECKTLSGEQQKYRGFFYYIRILKLETGFGIFKQYENSKFHKTALTFEYIVPEFCDALAVVHENVKTVMEQNRHCF